MTIHRIKLPEDQWIDVQELKLGLFAVVDESLTVKGGDWIIDATELGFEDWDDEVTDLDNGHSDESQCFGMSCHLRWQDVEFACWFGFDELDDFGFKAPSIKRLKEALTHVTLCAWCGGDI